MRIAFERALTDEERTARRGYNPPLCTMASRGRCKSATELVRSPYATHQVRTMHPRRLGTGETTQVQHSAWVCDACYVHLQALATKSEAATNG